MQEFAEVVGELEAADRWWLEKWMEMVKPAERVFVLSAHKAGTGPLVLVGADVHA
jgi:hypothetical protein